MTCQAQVEVSPYSDSGLVDERTNDAEVRGSFSWLHSSSNPSSSSLLSSPLLQQRPPPSEPRPRAAMLGLRGARAAQLPYASAAVSPTPTPSFSGFARRLPLLASAALSPLPPSFSFSSASAVRRDRDPPMRPVSGALSRSRPTTRGESSCYSFTSTLLLYMYRMSTRYLAILACAIRINTRFCFILFPTILSGY